VIKLPACILFEKCIYILALEMASPGNRHCANCIGTLSFPITPAGQLNGNGTNVAGIRVPFSQCFVVHRVFAFCLDVCWHDFARNADIRRITNRPPLSSITKSRRLTSFGHLARMDENADASQAIFEPPPENWRRPPMGPRTTWMNIHDDLSSLDLGIQDR